MKSFILMCMFVIAAVVFVSGMTHFLSDVWSWGWDLGGNIIH